ncbi:MAG TPA: hypothetical protein VMI54_01060 [Polyangiaceae bacterium]|nr:hypothetical protein [Polyangiaceae bacterium]
MIEDTDPELSDLLGRARAGLGPTAADASRVRAAVDAAVAGGSRASNARTGSGGGSAGLHWLRWVGLAAAVAGAGAGALGYARYRAAAERERARLSEPTAVLQIPVQRATEPPASAAPPLIELSAPEPAPQASAPAASTASAPAARAASSGESSLELEARLLARVERALRDGDPRTALGVLDELERKVPGGALAEERAAGRVLAECELGTARAAKLASDFTARHAHSAYAARIADACSRAGAEHGDAGQ